MRVLGIASDTTSFCWALLDGEHSNPQLLDVPASSIRFPVNGDESDRLLALKRLVAALLGEKHVEMATIVEAVGSQFRGPSSTRVKAECVFQLAARENQTAVGVVSPNTVSAQEKKFLDIVGASPEDHLNSGNNFSSKLLRKAVLVGWVGLV